VLKKWYVTRKKELAIAKHDTISTIILVRKAFCYTLDISHHVTISIFPPRRVILDVVLKAMCNEYSLYSLFA